MANLFIVRPFGNKRPVIQKNSQGIPEVTFFDFDSVEEKLIKPCMKKLELSGGTTGEIFESGEIKEDMFSELLLADIVIADISIYNANVFYELGVRHALRDKRTVLIKCPGYDETPFDIMGYKYVTYDNKKPEEALPNLIKTIEETLNADRKDSPVFNMLPKLKQQDTEKFLAVPEEFGEEVAIATTAKMVGKLKLLTNEARGFSWEMPAIRYLGESFFSLKELDEARALWEKVKVANRNDLQANDRLSTIYQRLADRDLKLNPENAAALLVQSDLAIETMLKDYKSLDLNKRAEAYALKARNAKTKWVNTWKDLFGNAREIAALGNIFLETAYKNYEFGFYENLNHFYSGINALGLLTILITLAERYPQEWSQAFNSDDEAAMKLKTHKDKLQKLIVSIQFSLDGERRRLETANETNIWFNITEADFTLLTATRPARVAMMYKNSLSEAKNFHIDAVKNQIVVYRNLNILPANVEAALSAIPVIPDSNWTQTQYLLFTGHMIDKPDRQESRFPAEKEAEARLKIKEKVSEALAITGDPSSIIGIAGGACGGDILFHEVCAELNIPTQLYLAMPREQFLVESVAFAGPGWISRFDKLYNKIKHFELSQKSDLPKWLFKKPDYDIWKRNNLWQLHSAMVNGGMNMTLIALWDGKGGDGPGGTEHMVQEAKKRGAKTVVFNVMDKTATSTALQ